MGRGGSVYILTNQNNGVFYTGVTSNLLVRIEEHRNKFFAKCFTSRYNISKLVYFKNFSTIEDAIAEEKRIKGGSRKCKVALIESIKCQMG